jgi:hypothetical protein
MPPATSKSVSQPVVSTETLTLYDNDEYDDVSPSTTPGGCSGETIFTMENGSKHDLKDILSVTENHAISIKSTFHSKPINILINTRCDIVCVSSHIASHNKKVHDLKVHSFNGGIVKCSTKTDIEWKMSNIFST